VKEDPWNFQLKILVLFFGEDIFEGRNPIRRRN
jgi:hypothetical protein